MFRRNARGVYYIQEQPPKNGPGSTTIPTIINIDLLRDSARRRQVGSGDCRWFAAAQSNLKHFRLTVGNT